MAEVWILYFSGDYDGYEVLGVYSSEALAENEASRLVKLRRVARRDLCR